MFSFLRKILLAAAAGSEELHKKAGKTLDEYAAKGEKSEALPARLVKASFDRAEAVSDAAVGKRSEA